MPRAEGVEPQTCIRGCVPASECTSSPLLSTSFLLRLSPSKLGSILQQLKLPLSLQLRAIFATLTLPLTPIPAQPVAPKRKNSDGKKGEG
jgi:hypothetical protein